MKPKSIRTVHPKGWPVEFEIEPADPKLHEIITDLARLGYRPDTANSDICQYTPDGLPICPIHGEVMPKREKQGDTWFSHKVTDPTTGEVTYCRGYPSKSGPGYAIRPHTNGR